MAGPMEFTDANFDQEVLQSDVPVLVDFWASWCAPCNMVAPIVEEIANEYDGRAKVGKVDVDANPQTAGKFGIRSIPSLLVFQGGKVVNQVVGAQPKQMITEKLDAVIA